MRVLIVDDEPPSRLALRQYLAALPDATIVAECGDGQAAIAAIMRHAPDVMFLDVQMPGVSGLEVLERVGADAVPAVIFVTAFDRYAVRAFEAHAVDYLLKPIDPDRFRDAWQRAARQVEREGTQAGRLEALAAEGGQAQPLERFVVRVGDRLQFVEIDQVEWIEADGNYARLHAGKAVHTLRRTITGLAARLSGRFVRIRRSALVNIGAVAALESWGKGSYVVHLRTGEKLISSRYAGRALRPLINP